MAAPLFAPTRQAAQARIDAVQPSDYARSRNAIEGAVTYLSPYITHGLVTLPEVLADVASRYGLDVQHKFVFELGWREFFRHVWANQGDGIFESLHDGPLCDLKYERALPEDIRQARTGVPAIDMAVRTLYATGTLHNHARMWLASYIVHLRKVHWRTGADWLYSHLLDGDLASNQLSWQWVAGTGSSKPYLFNADNVARYAPPPWHSKGSVVDCSYEALDAIAHSLQTVCRPQDIDATGLAEPQCFQRPPAGASAISLAPPDAAAVAGRHVWLVHPWALREPPQDLPADTLCVGVLLSDFHDPWPWSAARWSFVGSRMADITSQVWYGRQTVVSEALTGARSVRAQDDFHWPRQWSPHIQRRPAPRLFAELEQPATSFSKWWS